MGDEPSSPVAMGIRRRLVVLGVGGTHASNVSADITK